ncbi:HAD family hydrolase [Paraburkholderia bannensis]|uniref:HAD family hydrolase n=1 Tax=Paraburkholderia bannensis TaxID=765414 RepID=UPI002AC34CF0|nr:HAD family phosphatase [Paraburkholderia bannensis]
MNPFALVLFDMDDVLCHYDREARVRGLAAVSGRTEPEVIDAVWSSGLEARADAGLVDDDEYLAETGRLLGCRVGEKDWLRTRKQAMVPNHAVLKLASAVSKVCRIAVLTNNPQLVATNITFLCPEVAGIFGEHVFASASFKAAKPETAVFHRCLDQLGVPPHRTLFIDDLRSNVDGARQAGLHAHQYTDSRALREVLVSCDLVD